jgi:hypothetical protein
MLLESYTKEIFNSECQPGAMAVHCFAHLDQDVGEAIPYLNAALGGFTFTKDPPSVTFKVHGKLITVHAKKIARLIRPGKTGKKLNPCMNRLPSPRLSKF